MTAAVPLRLYLALSCVVPCMAATANAFTGFLVVFMPAPCSGEELAKEGRP